MGHKIEVRSYEIDQLDETENNNWFNRAVDASHAFIVYADDQGNEQILRGGPNPETGNILANYGEYSQNGVDGTNPVSWRGEPLRETPREIRSVVVAEGGAELAAVFAAMKEQADAINKARIPYIAWGHNVQNSNSVVATVLEEVGLEPNFPPGWHPGRNVNLLEEHFRQGNSKPSSAPASSPSPKGESKPTAQLPANAYEQVAAYVRNALASPNLAGLALDNRIAQALINGETDQAAAKILSQSPNAQQAMQAGKQPEAFSYIQARLEQGTQLNNQTAQVQSNREPEMRLE
ncbi:MAG: hypothetical protein ACFB4I_13010 [Cyanophyceae cyanobacterium]